MGKSSSSASGWKSSIELVIGLWLLFAPLALGFFNNPSAALVTILVATTVFFVSQLGIANQQPWEEWVNLIAAVVLIVAPWVLGYASVAAAVWNSVICGGLLVLLTVLTMVEEYASLKHKTSV